jgi:hypothetical protein
LFASALSLASLKFAILNPKNDFTVLISRVENQIDYHTYNSSILNHLPKPGGLPMAAKATNLCESVKPFPDRQSPDLSDALSFNHIVALRGDKPWERKNLLPSSKSFSPLDSLRF